MIAVLCLATLQQKHALNQSCFCFFFSWICRVSSWLVSPPADESERPVVFESGRGSVSEELDFLKTVIDQRQVDGREASTLNKPSRRRKRFLSYPRYVELMVTADAKMTRHHGRNLEHYILTIMSVVSKILFLNLFIYSYLFLLILTLFVSKFNLFIFLDSLLILFLFWFSQSNDKQMLYFLGSGRKIRHLKGTPLHL